MTSEIAILNKSAIAVAADSAVTIGENKVHRSANKIFKLCEKDPIGVMIYGYAEFCGCPRETIIKLFRDGNKKRFKTVGECAQEFKTFIGGSQFITQDVAVDSTAYFYISVLEKLKNRISTSHKKNMSQHIKNMIDEEINYYNNLGLKIEHFEISIKEFRRKCGNDVKTVADTVFNDINYSFPKWLYASITELVYCAITSSYMSNHLSGIVFFGFGNNETYPSLYSYEVDGAPLMHLRLREKSKAIISHKVQSVIVPFADRSQAEVFMEGINTDMFKFFISLTYDTAIKMADKIVNANLVVTPDERAMIGSINNKIISGIMDTYIESARAYIHKQNVTPVINSIRYLPKEDMATLAEALIEVTALRSKVYDAVESVGGPIDVCVVTKTDGFIWIKRKHYFDLEHNRHILYPADGCPLGCLEDQNGKR